jgi:FPC/CPF motif-containing protein YcgG
MNIVGFLHAFVDHYRVSNNAFTSAVVIFAGPNAATEATFDTLLWTRLQALADVDAETYAYDPRVSADPASPDFSFCIKSEALYVIGLHPGSSRKARRFSRPALVFNPHQQFEWLRTTGKYESMKRSVRNRDLVYAGSVNPMLADFGAASEASQYSGKKYDEHWKCPFISRHGRTDDHTAAKRSGLYDEKGTTTGGNGH